MGKSKEDIKTGKLVKKHQKRDIADYEKTEKVLHAAKSEAKKAYKEKVRDIRKKAESDGYAKGKADADKVLAKVLHEEALRNERILGQLKAQETAHTAVPAKPVSRQEAFEEAAMAQLDDMSDDELRQTTLLGLACSAAAVIGIGALTVGGFKLVRRLVR